MLAPTLVPDVSIGRQSRFLILCFDQKKLGWGTRLLFVNIMRGYNRVPRIQSFLTPVCGVGSRLHSGKDHLRLYVLASFSPNFVPGNYVARLKTVTLILNRYIFADKAMASLYVGCQRKYTSMGRPVHGSFLMKPFTSCCNQHSFRNIVFEP